jgi:GT2 family glycosyltransferase
MNLPIQIILYKSDGDLPRLLESFQACSSSTIIKPVFHFVQHDDIDAKKYLRILDKFSRSCTYTFDTNENVGFASGHNWLFDKYAASYDDFFMILNPDTMFFFDFFIKLERHLKECSRLLGAVDMCQFPQEFPKLYDYETLETVWCSGTAMLIRMSVFQEIGGFDDAFFMYYEDTDLSWRIQYRGYKTYYFPDCKIVHKVGGSSRGDEEIEENSFCVAHNLAGELYMTSKYGLKNKGRVDWILNESALKEEVKRIYGKMISNGIETHPRKNNMKMGNILNHRW